MQIKDYSTILFQGDSITDVNRDYLDINSLGNGYVSIIADILNSKFPKKHLTIINKGESGNQSLAMKNRWQQDCIDLKPDILSILIGINDTWRRYDCNDATTTDAYALNVQQMLQNVKIQLPNTKIIIIEPFLLHINKGIANWREDLNPKIMALRELAVEYADIYIPMDGLFAVANLEQKADFWATDGVHPTIAGHELIAKHWLEALNLSIISK